MSRGPSAILSRALCRAADAAGVRVEVVAASASDWASATFVGARHQMRLAASASPALDAWLALLPTADIVMPGHVLAELSVVRSWPTSAVPVEIDLSALTLAA